MKACLIGAGSKPASALYKLSAFGVSVLSLRRDGVTRQLMNTPRALATFEDYLLFVAKIGAETVE